VIATLQVTVALLLSYQYDHWEFRSFLIGPVYPLLYWTLAAGAALRSQVIALARGPSERSVVWHLEREPVE
jgi:poly-beta-1,6-N-acetyl-D-glucosamine synthase